MSAPTITDAVRLLNDRKRAAGALPGEPPIETIGAGPLIMGLDLDREELERIVSACADYYTEYAVRRMLDAGHIDLPRLVGSVWIDGLATGMTLAHLRQEATDV